MVTCWSPAPASGMGGTACLGPQILAAVLDPADLAQRRVVHVDRGEEMKGRFVAAEPLPLLSYTLIGGSGSTIR